MLDKIWTWLTDKNWKTWIGHIVKYSVIFFIVSLCAWGNWSIGAAGAIGMVLGREETNIEPYVMGKLLKTKEEIPFDKVVDGFFDWFAPTFVVIFLALLMSGNLA